MENLRREWAERLRSARLERGLTQFQLGEAADCSQTQISDWESGGTVPRDDTRMALAKALGMRVRDLFPYPDDDDEPNGDREAA